MVHRKGFTMHSMTVTFLKLAKELTHPFFFLKGVVSIMKCFQCPFWENVCPLKSDFPLKKHSANHWVNFISQLPLQLQQLFFRSNWIIYISHCNQLAYSSSTWGILSLSHGDDQRNVLLFDFSVVPSSYKKHLHFPHLLWVGPRDNCTSSIEAFFITLKESWDPLRIPKITWKTGRIQKI